MDCTIKEVLGGLMLATPLVAIFICACRDIGLKAVMAGVGIVLAVGGWLVLGAHLIESCN